MKKKKNVTINDLENLILVEYRTTIEKLEKKVERLEEILAVK